MSASNLSLRWTCLVLCALGTAAVRADEFVPEPPVTPFEQRVTPYSMTYYQLSADPDYNRKMLSALKDAGITRSLTLIYWWQHETLGDDSYWKADYKPQDLGEGYLRKLDLYVNTSIELGMKPSFRLGSQKEFPGYWHPADKTKSVENYAKWVKRIAERYRGKIDHYVIGDEENQEHAAWGWDGSAKTYMEQMYLPLAKAIREGDPKARISACAVSSAPATAWIMELIKLGLPAHGDGIAMNLWHDQFEDPEIAQSLKQIRQAWPAVRFYANGMGYVVHRHGTHDEEQAAAVARVMFNVWDLGWESAPYYLYTYSITADTKENYGIMGVAADGTLEPSDAMRSYQTIAQTFYDRDALKEPSFKIRLEPAEKVPLTDGKSITIAPPTPKIRAFVRSDALLIIYLTYRDGSPRTRGLWNLILESDDWGQPEQIPLLDYKKRVPLQSMRAEGQSKVANLLISGEPTIVTLRRRK